MLGSFDTGIVENQFYWVVSISCQCAVQVQTVQHIEWKISPHGNLDHPASLSYGGIFLLITSWLLPLKTKGLSFLPVHALCSSLNVWTMSIKTVALITQKIRQPELWMLFKGCDCCLKAHSNHTDEKMETKKSWATFLKPHRQVMQAGFKPRSVWL